MKVIPNLLLLIPILSSTLLSSVDFTTNVVYTQLYLFPNYIGLSFNFDELLPHMSNLKLQGLLANSVAYGDWAASFSITVHIPKGYPVNCTLTAAMNTSNPITCTQDLLDNSTVKTMGSFIGNVSTSFAFYLGWDYQNANFSNSSYMNSFIQYYSKLHQQVGYIYHMV